MKKQNKNTPKHRWMDFGLAARGERLIAFVPKVSEVIDQNDFKTGRRKRRMRPADRALRDEVLEVAVSNLAHAVLFPPETGFLAVLTGTKARSRRYFGPAVGRPLRDVLGGLFALDLITYGPRNPASKEATPVAVMESFRSMAEEAQIAPCDFGRRGDEELILLSKKVRHETGASSRERIDYEETPETTGMRETMRRLNAFLAEADVRALDDGLGPVDTNDRTMRRYFVDCEGQPAWGCGGRLYGGFWQNLPRGRRTALRINGEEVMVLDFASMFPRLAYLHVGAVPPGGDVYGIAGLEEHRGAVKLIMNTFLFDRSNRRTTWPRDAKTPQPPDWAVTDLRSALLAVHPPLKKAFGKGIGLSLMHTESLILIATLEEMMRRGIVGLGLHDGLLVARSRADEGRVIMEEAAQVVTSVRLPVAIKAASG